MSQLYDRAEIYDLIENEKRTESIRRDWDHNPNGSITFNLLYTFEQKEKIVQKEIFEEHYYPFPLKIVEEKLSDLGYDKLYFRFVPCDIPETDFEKIDWYRVIARKSAI